MSEMTAFRRRGLAACAVAAAVLCAGWPAARGAAQADGPAKMALGRQVFTQIAQPQCGICHTLEDAGTKGEIGAKLEELQPDEQRVLLAVRKGVGVMPPYADKLTEEQIRAVAYYVSRAVRQGK
jgi:cytochrome c6